MRIELENKKGISIVVLKGRITVKFGDIGLREYVLKLFESGERNFLINFGGLLYINSSGIGELLSIYSTVTRDGGKLKLLNLPPKIKDILEITNLISIFDIYEDEEEALASFYNK